MKRYAKLVQTDTRGQIVIPKEVRRELSIEEGDGFAIYVIENEGLFLKLLPAKGLAHHDKAVTTIKQHAPALNINKRNIDASLKHYERKRRGNFEDV